MNKFQLLIAAGAACLMVGCAATQPGGLAVHEVQLYGENPQRLLWAYSDSAPSQLTVAGQAVNVQPTGSADGQLLLNGQPFLTQPLAAQVALPRAVQTANGLFNVSGGPSLSDLYYVSGGGQWYKLSAVAGNSLRAMPASSLNTLGSLTPAETRQLQGALAKSAPLMVGVVRPEAMPAQRTPAGTESRLTGLVLTRPTQATATTPRPARPAVPAAPAQGATVNVKIAAQGSNAAAQEPLVQVAADQAAAQRLYNLAYGRQSPKPTAPSVAGKTLVGVFLGQRMTGGYSVQLVSASNQGGVLNLQVRESAPGKDMLVTQALTSPWAIFEVPGHYSDVKVTGLSSVSSTTAPGGYQIR